MIRSGHIVPRTLLLCLFVVSLWGSNAYPMGLSSAQSKQLEYTDAQPYMLPFGAPDLRGKQAGDHHRPIFLQEPTCIHAFLEGGGASVGRIVLGADPPVITHLVLTRLTASGL